MSRNIEIENNIDKNIRLKIKLQNNNIFKETFIETQRNIRMRTFFKVDYNKIVNEIEDGSYSIYFLINDIENSIYVGKSKNFLSRLQGHYQNPKKEFNRIIQLSSKDWTPTIIDYLEYWFIDFFYNNKIFTKFVNNKLEKEPNFTYSDEEYIDNALENLKWLLLTEGININSNKNKTTNFFVNEIKEESKKESNKYWVYLTLKNVEAIYNKNEKRLQKIKLLKNTKVIWNKYNVNDYPGCFSNIHRYNHWFEKNIKLKKITRISSNEFLLNDDLKTSPSLASCLIFGHFTRNGTIDWKTKDGRTIKELENE